MPQIGLGGSVWAEAHETFIFLSLKLYFCILAVLGPHCRAGVSLAVVSGGFSYCRAPALGPTGFSSCSLQALGHRLGSCAQA